MSKFLKVFLVFTLVVLGVATTSRVNAMQKSRWLTDKESTYSTFVNEFSQEEVYEYSDKRSLEYDRDLLTEAYNDFSIENEIGSYSGNYWFTDVDGYTFKVTRNVLIQDTTPPEFEGLSGMSVDFGSKFDYSDLGVSGVDGYDGALEVSYSGDVDTNKAGSYEVVMTVEDSSGNSTEASVTVVVKEKPVVKSVPKVSGSKTEKVANGGKASLPNQSIYFHKTSVIVPYANIGTATDENDDIIIQKYIDKYRNNAATFYGSEALDSFTSTHSNRDGLQTYFAAHASHGFKSAMEMAVGERVTVRDSSGHEQVYEVYRRDVLYGGSYALHIWNNGLDVEREGLVFQTCLSENPLPVALTFLKAVN